MSRSVVLSLSLLVVTTASGSATTTKEPAWVSSMREVHARSRGQKGTLIHLGDSITYSMAYFAPLQYARDATMSPSARDALKTIDSPSLKHPIPSQIRNASDSQHGLLSIKGGCLNSQKETPSLDQS